MHAVRLAGFLLIIGCLFAADILQFGKLARVIVESPLRGEKTDSQTLRVWLDRTQLGIDPTLYAAPFTVASPLVMSANRVLSVTLPPSGGGGTTPTITPGAGIYAVNVYNADGTVAVAPVLNLEGNKPTHGALCQPPKAFVGADGFHVCAPTAVPMEHRWRRISWEALP